MSINFNTEPYYDDYDETKKFYRILYRPGFAVQARELTQMQTILQNQITRFGDHVFKEGAMVIPGQVSVDTDIAFVKLEPTSGGTLTDSVIDALKDQIIVGGTSGVRAKVLAVSKASGADPSTLFVRYLNSGDNSTSKTFSLGEELQDLAQTISVDVASAAATGKGSIATVARGVYFLKGHFVLVEDQTIILDKYTNEPTYRVGVLATESIVTAEDDETLFDNAQNSFNFAAPGAHRYFIDAVLTKLAVDEENDTDFIELVRVENGQTKRQVRSTEYSILEETLARRTFDESGDYTVRNFEIDVREYRNNNRGAWASSVVYMLGDVVTSNNYTYVAKTTGTSSSIAPSHLNGTAFDGPSNTGVQWEYNETPVYNRGVYIPENSANLVTNQQMESKLAVGLEPGKAYVRGYEIEKISTEFVTVEKARDSVQINNAVIPATVGNYVLVNNVNNLPPVSDFGVVTIYDQITGSAGRGTAVGNVVGTARVRAIEWEDGDRSTQQAVYKLFLFDIKMVAGNESFSKYAKSFYFNVSGDPQLSFSADINPITLRLVGSVTASSTSVVGTGTSFQTDLVVGDYIILGTELRRVTAIASQNALTVNASVTVTGATVDLVTTEIREPEGTSLVYAFPYYAVKSVRDELLANDTSYTVYESFSGTASGSGVLTVSTTSGTFSSAAGNTNYIVVDNSAADGGTIVDLDAEDISPVGSSVTFNLGAGFAGKQMKVVAAVNKTGTVLTEKNKTLVSGATVVFDTLAAATSREILLGKADGFRLVNVKMKSGTFAAPGASFDIDITDRYEFDNGQRTSHYDIARILLKGSFASPSAPIQVTFDYFTHSTGDYFTVNSYPATVDYKQIPTFGGISLRDSIDFRPRIADNGLGFSGTGATISLMPKRGIDVRADFSYYLPRKTKIALDFSGNFFSIDGVSSQNPGDPQDPDLGMILYTLTLEPYTFGTSNNNVVIDKQDNKRYTMRDIGKLEKRIDNLEYYTALSLLEQQTESLDIIDADGNSRFKNGFVVDGFTGHTTGDVNSQDYVCSIDMENAELRPFFSQQNINLLEKKSNDLDRAASNYKAYGDVITLPVVDQIPLVVQKYASRLENINPFAVFTFLGDVKLTPSSDDWFEVDRRPDLVIDVEGNFNAVKTAAERSGVLGTIWNSWQTQWRGTPVLVSTSRRRIEDRSRQHASSGVANSGWRRDITTGTFATQVSQTRTGVKTSVVARIDRQVVGDRVLSVAAVPYIRSRNILIQVKGLKPSTKFYPFFDDVAISEYCTPASKIFYTPISGQFDDVRNVGGLASQEARRINGDSQVCLTRGDVITGGTSGATAVVVGTEYNPEANTYAVFVVNIKGTFSATETITGSLTSAQGTVVSSTIAVEGGDIITNFSGEAQMLFNIPNTDEIRFRTGNREFKLIDVPEAQGQFTSRGRANYRAEGVLESRQQTVHAVRNADLVEEQVRDNRVIVETSSRVVADSGWYDPLAQSFLVESRGGAFLSKVDVFFASRDSAIPVTMEIRDMVNGYPGKRVLPFSRVTLSPNQVNLSTANVTLDGQLIPSYDTPTSFIFPSPVYVEDNQEYCVVLLSDSNNYKVWISQLGDPVPGTSQTISEQPYLGSLFKSQNASTWTADQTQDLKFTIYRCQFDTQNIANIEFVNDVNPLQTLDFDPFEMRGATNLIRVWQRNHGMTTNSVVAITNNDIEEVTGITATGTITTSTSSKNVSGSTAPSTLFTTEVEVGSVLYTSAGTYIGIVESITDEDTLVLRDNAAVALVGVGFKVTYPINGIPTTEIYKNHTISEVDLDSYVISVTSNATASGYFGGTSIRASRNYQYDALEPSVQIQSFSETTTGFSVKTVSGKSVDSLSQAAYVADTAFSGVVANETNSFNTPRMVASEINETTLLSGNKSLTMSVTMSSDNDALSPVLDTHRTSMILVSNKVNYPEESRLNVAPLDSNTVLTASTAVAFSGSTMTTTDAATRAIFAALNVGKYLTISRASGTQNAGTFLITNVSDNGTTATVTLTAVFVTETAGVGVTLVQRERFVDEIAPVESSTFSKYVTKKISLANTSTFIRVRFAANIPDEADVEVYYKTSAVGSTVPFEDVTYTRMQSDTPVIKFPNESDRFIDLNFSDDNIPAFDSIQVKLVLKSRNSSEVPRVKDLRIIAAA